MRVGIWVLISTVVCCGGTQVGGIADGGSEAEGGADANVIDVAPPDGHPADGSTDAPVGGSTCQAASVIALATANGAADQIMLDGGFVYFHEASGIWRVPRGGGTAQLVAAHLAGAWTWPSLATFGIDDAGGTMIWTEPGQGANATDVLRVSLQGGSPTVVGSTGSPFPRLGIEPSGLAYAWSPPTYVLAMITQQNALSLTAIQCPTNTEKIVFDSGALYTASEYGIFQLQDPSAIALSSVRAFGLAVDATTIYFTDHCKAGMSCTLPSLLPYPTGQVWSVPRGGGTSTSLAQANGLLGGLAVDATRVYFANRQDGTITRMNKDGTNSSVIGTSGGGEQAIDVAVDDQCVYWSASSGDNSPSTIYAAPK